MGRPDWPARIVRKIINLAFALGLLLGGSTALVYLLFFSPGWRGVMIIGSGFAATLGAYWLYEDFVPKGIK